MLKNLNLSFRSFEKFCKNNESTTLVLCKISRKLQRIYKEVKKQKKNRLLLGCHRLHHKLILRAYLHLLELLYLISQFLPKWVKKSSPTNLPIESHLYSFLSFLLEKANPQTFSSRHKMGGTLSYAFHYIDGLG